jgi:hypothetical protein
MASRVSCGVLEIHISFDILPLSTDEADQTGKPDETRDDGEMTGIHKFSKDCSRPGGGPSKIWDISGRLSGK